jgi:hypothetical protein
MFPFHVNQRATMSAARRRSAVTLVELLVHCLSNFRQFGTYPSIRISTVVRFPKVARRSTPFSSFGVASIGSKFT